MINFSIVVGVLNNWELARTAIRSMVSTLEHPEETEIIIIDNGSDVMMPEDVAEEELPIGMATGIRNEKNTGNYPLFKQGLGLAQGHIVAFLHSDVFVYQKGWDTAVRAQFAGHPELGLMGFIGSTELDNWGGRGMGTVSNMQGRTVNNDRVGQWKGSQGSVHGKVSSGMTIDGSVVDGCVMIFSKEVLARIGFKDEYPPHHFYDRLMSAQVIELGYKVGILGIEFDHVSGQTANTQQKYQDTAKEWFKARLGIDTPQQWAEHPERKDWVLRGNSPSKGKIPDQWDYCCYLEAEYLFLTEYRDRKHLVPLVYGRRI
jgi:GT2 family glycosyltransferase